jgi:hypothetical protein
VVADSFKICQGFAAVLRLASGAESVSVSGQLKETEFAHRILCTLRPGFKTYEARNYEISQGRMVEVGYFYPWHKFVIKKDR